MVLQMLQEMRRESSQSHVTDTKNGTRKYRFLKG